MGHPDRIQREAKSVNEHPQIEAFLQAAASMRDNRYWARNRQEQLAFLGVLRDVITEVCFHLDHNQVLDPTGLTAFATVAGIQSGVPWLDASAESALLPCIDDAIQRYLAALETTDNTGGDPEAWPSIIGQPAPPS